MQLPKESTTSKVDMGLLPVSEGDTSTRSTSAPTTRRRACISITYKTVALLAFIFLYGVYRVLPGDIWYPPPVSTSRPIQPETPFFASTPKAPESPTLPQLPSDPSAPISPDLPLDPSSPETPDPPLSLVSFDLDEPLTPPETQYSKHHKLSKHALAHHLTHPVHLSGLPQHLSPAFHHKRRVIVVGDVHGCAESLRQLLKVTEFDPSHDYLVLAGDMIARGPDSVGAVELARSVGAGCVRGNHEDNTLKALADYVSGYSLTGEDTDSGLETLKKHKLPYHLSMDDILWLADCPVILDLGPLPGAFPHADSAVVVHAGLVPTVDLEDQDDWAVMHMRALEKTKRGIFKPQEDRRMGQRWYIVWDKIMEQLSWFKKWRDNTTEEEEEEEENDPDDGLIMESRPLVCDHLNLDFDCCETLYSIIVEEVEQVQFSGEEEEKQLPDELIMESRSLITDDLNVDLNCCESFNSIPVDSEMEQVQISEEDAATQIQLEILDDLLGPGTQSRNHHHHHYHHPSPKNHVVIYGHDARTGLNILKWSKGLDSACLSGGQLSALIIDVERSRVESVDCSKVIDDL